MAQPSYIKLAHHTPHSFAYVPAVVIDNGMIRMWYSGREDGNTGGVIYHCQGAFNADHSQIVWSTPQVVLSHNVGGPSWEEQDLCDPSVLKAPGGAFGSAKWVMFYGSSPVIPGQAGGGDNIICAATSNDTDGKVWTRFGPILGEHGQNVGRIGLSQPSVIRLGDGFRMTYIRDTVAGQENTIYRSFSSNGTIWPNHVPWPSPHGGTPGMDILYDNTQTNHCYWAVYTGPGQHEHLARAENFGAPWEVVQVFNNVRSHGAGWVRQGNGVRPAGPLISYFGTPPYADNPYDFSLQELRGVKWGI